MINKNLPEPEVKECCNCFRMGPEAHLIGLLVHWPDEDCTKEEVTLSNGQKVTPFSLWLYECRWCRSAFTRKRNSEKK